MSEYAADCNSASSSRTVLLLELDEKNNSRRIRICGFLRELQSIESRLPWDRKFGQANNFKL